MSADRRIGIASLILGLLVAGVPLLYSSHQWLGWVCIASACVLVCWWITIELQPDTPSLPFVFGAPLGDNESPDWIMTIKHYGPTTAYNCKIAFFDKDRKNLEHAWLVQHPLIPYPPKHLAGESQKELQFSEASASSPIGSFHWTPLDPDRQHYSVSIYCRDAMFVEDWEVTRVHGTLRTQITIRRGEDWIKLHPGRNPIIFACRDPEFESVPLADTIPAARKPAVHPGWKPNHKFAVPVAIIDPNKNIQIVSAVKRPDGGLETDFGCWKILTQHLGGERPSIWRRVFNALTQRKIANGATEK